MTTTPVQPRSSSNRSGKKVASSSPISVADASKARRADRHPEGRLAAQASPVDADEPWQIAKWSSLQEKRLKLTQQRVALERRLFESAPQFTTPDAPASTSTPTSTTVMLVQDMAVTLEEHQEAASWSGPLNEDGEPEGTGKMVYQNGQVYQGQVVRGQRQGRGTNTWPNGQVFTGCWTTNSRTGRGTHAWPDGKTVTGHWVGGHLQGRCFFQWPDGATYDGDTVGGKKAGRGVHTWGDGKVYRGHYDVGFEHGFGTLTEAAGVAKYRGQFKLGQRHGYGVQIWKEKTYDGEWEYNAVAGQGKLQWQTGACYTGSFLQGRYSGQGTYVDDDGRKYVGRWTHGQKDGYGVDVWTNGQRYEGHYKDGRRSGYGRMTNADGSIYAGGWWRNKKSGRGILIAAHAGDEVIHCGLWSHDGPLEEPPTGYSQDDWSCNAAGKNKKKHNKKSKADGSLSSQDDINITGRTVSSADSSAGDTRSHA